jgi:hypothetical protein
LEGGARIIHVVDDQERVATSDLLTDLLRIPNGQRNRGHSMRLANAMKRLGWERPPDDKKITIEGKQVRGYFRWIKKPDAGAAEASVRADTKDADPADPF